MKGTLSTLCIWIFMELIPGSLMAQDGFRVLPYLQYPAPDAMTILWFSEELTPGQLSWWEKDVGLVDSVESNPIAADALAYSTWEDTMFFKGEAPSFPYQHRIRLEGLNPGTSYEYQVNQGGDSFSAFFKTAPAGYDSIRFIVYADSETEPESTYDSTSWANPDSNVSRNYLIDQTTGYRNNLDVIRLRRPDLVLIAGDLTQHGGEQRDWDEFWNHNTNAVTELSLAGQIPIMAAPGNHDYYEGNYLGKYNQPGSERAINRFLTYFDPPSNQSPNVDQEGRYYSMKYGPATFIALDLCNNSPKDREEDTNFYLLGENDPEGGNAPAFGVGSLQYSWLEQQLLESQENSLFTFVFFHHAPYSSGPHGFPAGIGDLFDSQSGVPVRALTPLFMKYGVDAVFSGHDEMWERSEVPGTEIQPDGSEVDHTIQFYDVGTGGDGLRGPVSGTDNPFQKFLVHLDVPEVWEEHILVEGGKHYGHLEVDIVPREDHTWEAILKPAYIFPLFNAIDTTYAGYERRVYDDQVILTSIDTVSTVSDGDRAVPYLITRSYPNPFWEQANIEYMIPEACKVTIYISDAQGRLVRMLQDGNQAAGSHSISWAGIGVTGQKAAPGLYFYHIETGSGNRQSGKMLLMNQGQ